MNEGDRESVRKWVQTAVLTQAQKDPAYLAECEKLKLQKAAALAKGEARDEELREDPRNQKLDAGVRIPCHVGRHMRVGELRNECAIRGLDTSGYKAALVKRLDDLDAYSAADVAIASAQREAELKKRITRARPRLW